MILQLDGDMTIRDLVGRHPQTRSVFERHEIDYCCGGGKSLAEACGNAAWNWTLCVRSWKRH